MRYLLLAFGFASLLLSGAAVADPATDYSSGFTNTHYGAATAQANDAAWEAQQRAAEAEANAALAKASTSSDTTVAPGELGPGDKIRLTVFGEDDLSGEFDIDNTGSLALPLVGEVQARGLTPRQLEKRITEVLSNGYLVNPRVSVEVLNFRPFFILGEVNKPGSYPYVNNLTVINAVATAGGYTPRAKKGEVKMHRANGPDKEVWVKEDAKVYPGDVIRVEERFF